MSGTGQGVQMCYTPMKNTVLSVDILKITNSTTHLRGVIKPPRQRLTNNLLYILSNLVYNGIMSTKDAGGSFLWAIIVALCLMSTCSQSDQNKNDIGSLESDVESLEREVESLKTALERD